MQTSIDLILEQLEQIIKITKQLEEKYQGEVLTLQKIINYSFKSTPVIQRQLTKKQQEKSIIPQISVDSKIDALLNEFQIQKRNIQNQQKPKFEVKPPQIVIEKKPPLPTINRNQKNVKNIAPVFIAPKGRDGLAGKVTQTTIKTNDRKVFKPQLNYMKRGDSKVQKRPMNASKAKLSEGKTQKKEQERQIIKIVKRQQLCQQKKEETMPKYLQETPKEDRRQESTKNIVQKMVNFNKQLDQLMEELLSKDQKNHKKQLSKMISELQNEQKGHKMHEQTNRNTFSKHVYNYTASRNNVNFNSSHGIMRKRWKYHNYIFQLSELINKLQSQIQNVITNSDCRLDQKQEYRIIQSATKYSDLVNQIVEQSQLQIPEQLDLTFKFNQLQKNSNSNEESDFFQPRDKKLNEAFLHLLDEISQSGTLQKPQLRALQVLSEIGVFNSRRCPLLVMRSEYQNWKENYTKNNYEKLNYTKQSQI